MKKSILILAAYVLISGAILTGCKTPAQKVEDAENKVEQANIDLDEATEEYLADIEKYKKETNGIITANEQRILELRSKIKNSKGSAKADLEDRIADLEKKNNELKNELANYKGEGKDKWKTFKEEFEHDMEELEKALNDLAVDNVK